MADRTRQSYLRRTAKNFNRCARQGIVTGGGDGGYTKNPFNIGRFRHVDRLAKIRYKIKHHKQYAEIFLQQNGCFVIFILSSLTLRNYYEK